MSVASPQVPRPRIEGLSDLIFGLALSIGAIQLVGSVPKNYGGLVTDISAFGFSFIILINVWNRYTTTMSVMPVETRWVFRLNLVLLFLVAIEPFLFNLLVIPEGGLSSALGNPVSQYYALDVGGMNLILAYFTHTLTIEERNLIPRDLIDRYKGVRNILLLSTTIFFVSVLPPFWMVAVWGLPLRIVLWLLTFSFSMATRWLGFRPSEDHALVKSTMYPGPAGADAFGLKRAVAATLASSSSRFIRVICSPRSLPKSLNTPPVLE